jgi:hypothetical protein
VPGASSPSKIAVSRGKPGRSTGQRTAIVSVAAMARIGITISVLV